MRENLTSDQVESGFPRNNTRMFGNFIMPHTFKDCFVRRIRNADPGVMRQIKQAFIQTHRLNSRTKTISICINRVEMYFFHGNFFELNDEVLFYVRLYKSFNSHLKLMYGFCLEFFEINYVKNIISGSIRK